MKPKTAVITIASSNYLPYVKALMGSLRDSNPDYDRYFFLADKRKDQDPEDETLFKTVEACSIGIDNFDDLAFRYDIMEFNTAIKPFAIEWLFNNSTYSNVIYLDPDIFVYRKLSELDKILDNGASVVVTPHITTPLEDKKTPNDHHMLQSGVFNLGFIAIARKREALEFVSWWGRRLKTMCYSDIGNNLFTDQRWVDLAPSFLADIHILRNPAYNVAYWNLMQRPTKKVGHGLSVGGVKLAFFHFSGLNQAQPNIVSKHQDRLNWNDLGPYQVLFEKYRKILVDNGWGSRNTQPYFYDRVGTLQTSSVVRRLYRKNYPTVPNNIAIDEHFLLAMCNWPAEALGKSTKGITSLMHFIYCERADLQTAFSLTEPQGVVQFCNWFKSSALREYGLDPRLIVLSDIDQAAASEIVLPTPINSNAPNSDRPWLYQKWRKLRRMTIVLAQSLKISAFIRNHDKENATDYLYRNAFPELKHEQFKINNLMHLIWQARLDLQSAFDLSTPEGRSGFVGWFFKSVEREYGIDPTEATSGIQIRSGSKSTSYHSSPDLEVPKQGATLIGYASGVLGMGEHVRMTASALSAVGISFGIKDIKAGVVNKDESLIHSPSIIEGNDFRANVFHVNADQMFLTYGSLGASFFSNRYNIGYWAWELSKCPRDWIPVTKLVDEIWAPSKFIRDCFLEASDRPVVLMPLCVELPKFRKLSRKAFDLDDDTCVFLYIFDFHSYIERKNPLAAISAFKKAFPRRTDAARLVLKVMNADTSSPLWIAMMKRIGGDTRIIVRNEVMSRSKVLALVDQCDCFVSLHRSEGFGRGPAEAMYLGKPVIATGYSGNTDFTRPENSLVVDYKIVPLEAGQYVFGDGQVWAEPNVEHAAQHMRFVFDHSESARDLGMKGQRTIFDEFSAAAVGNQMNTRLAALGVL